MNPTEVQSIHDFIASQQQPELAIDMTEVPSEAEILALTGDVISKRKDVSDHFRDLALKNAGELL